MPVATSLHGDPSQLSWYSSFGQAAVGLTCAAHGPGSLGIHVAEQLLLERHKVRAPGHGASTELLGAMIRARADDDIVELLAPARRTMVFSANLLGLSVLSMTAF
jgi:hypothetical protein